MKAFCPWNYLEEECAPFEPVPIREGSVFLLGVRIAEAKPVRARFSWPSQSGHLSWILGNLIGRAIRNRFSPAYVVERFKA